MIGFKVGTVINYFEKVGMAIVELTSDLGVGEQIRLINGGDVLFEQEVTIIQKDHKKVSLAKRGDVVGLLLNEKVEKGTEVSRLAASS